MVLARFALRSDKGIQSVASEKIVFVEVTGPGSRLPTGVTDLTGSHLGRAN